MTEPWWKETHSLHRNALQQEEVTSRQKQSTNQVRSLIAIQDQPLMTENLNTQIEPKKKQSDKSES